MTTEEKVAALKAYREDQYQQLCDAVYKRRGWNDERHPDAWRSCTSWGSTSRMWSRWWRRIVEIA